MKKKNTFSNEQNHEIDKEPLKGENWFLNEKINISMENNSSIKKQMDDLSTKYEKLLFNHTEQSNRLENLKLLNEKPRDIILLNKSNKESSAAAVTEKKKIVECI